MIEQVSAASGNDQSDSITGLEGVDNGEFQVAIVTSVVSQVQHGVIRAAMDRTGWTAESMANYLCLSVDQFRNLLNLRWFPEDNELTCALRSNLESITNQPWHSIFPESIVQAIRESRGESAQHSAEVSTDLFVLEGADIRGLQNADKPFRDVLHLELTAAVDSALEKLGSPMAEVLDLHLLRGMSLEDIATKLDSTPANIRIIRDTALERLREPPFADELSRFWGQLAA